MRPQQLPLWPLLDKHPGGVYTGWTGREKRREPPEVTLDEPVETPGVDPGRDYPRMAAVQKVAEAIAAEGAVPGADFIYPETTEEERRSE